MDPVLLMHRCTPGIIAADTHLLCSDSDPCVANTWKFIQMHCVFEFIGTVWQYAHFKRSRRLLERQTMLHIIMDRERSYTGTVAAFLRIEIAGKILENHYHMTDFTVQDGTVRIYDFSQSVGEINREFARNGLLVTRINDSEENLEDYFSKLIGGGGIA